jgi:serine O-acetyltransferase
MFQHTAQDFGRCGTNAAERWREVLTNPGMWAVLGYRYRRWIYCSKLPWIVRKLLGFSSLLVDVCLKVTTHVEFPASADIGAGLYVPHCGGIVISSRTRIGKFCTLAHSVTIGHAGGGSKTSDVCPSIGDRVYIGPSAIILGPIEIEHDALIGAGALVVRSIPAGGVVVGNPGRVISRRGSFDLIEYPTMAEDAERVAALARLRPSHVNFAESHADESVCISD